MLLPETIVSSDCVYSGLDGYEELLISENFGVVTKGLCTIYDIENNLFHLAGWMHGSFPFNDMCCHIKLDLPLKSMRVLTNKFG